MSLSHSIGLTWGAGGSLLGTQVTKTGGVEQNLSLALGTVANQAVDMAWGPTKLLSIFITVTVDCTLFLNDVSGGSPTDTIALVAGTPFVWLKDSGVAYPFTGSTGTVTAGYITTTEATAVEVRTLLDL